MYREKLNQGDFKRAEEKQCLTLQDIAELWGITYQQLHYALKKNKLKFKYIQGETSIKNVLVDDVKNIDYKQIFS